MTEIIDLFDKFKNTISYEQMNEVLENATTVCIGAGDDGPTNLFITENDLVLGKLARSDAEFIATRLRTIANAIDDQMNKPAEAVDLFFIEKKGIYGHGVFWIGNDFEEAKKAADNAATLDRDAHHKWRVYKFCSQSLFESDAIHETVYIGVRAPN